MASCWLTFLLRTTVGLTNPANTALCWKAMVIDGTGSADSTICCVEPTSIRAIPTQVEKRTEATDIRHLISDLWLPHFSSEKVFGYRRAYQQRTPWRLLPFVY